MDYRKTALDILSAVGGKENIVSAAHCATRLRLVIGDNARCDKTAVENVEGVKGVFEAAGQLQIIIGTDVERYYTETLKQLGLDADKAAASSAEPAQGAEKKDLVSKFMDLMSGILAPSCLPLRAPA